MLAVDFLWARYCSPVSVCSCEWSWVLVCVTRRIYLGTGIRAVGSGWAFFRGLDCGCWHVCGFIIPLMRVILGLDGGHYGVRDIEDNGLLDGLLNDGVDLYSFAP